MIVTNIKFHENPFSRSPADECGERKQDRQFTFNANLRCLYEITVVVQKQLLCVHCKRVRVCTCAGEMCVLARV
jgi:hypothetical protein